MPTHYTYDYVKYDTGDEMGLSFSGGRTAPPRETTSIQWIALNWSLALPSRPEDAFLYSAMRDMTQAELDAHVRKCCVEAAQDLLRKYEIVKAAGQLQPHDAVRRNTALEVLSIHGAEIAA